jgi:flagellar motility protein MotE (MotC chaperone)
VVGAKAGWFDDQVVLSHIPLINGESESYATLQQENASLKKQVQTLTEELVMSQGSQSNAGIVSGNGAAAPTTGQQSVFDQTEQQVDKDQAKYYANMDPSVAASILSKQDLQTVAGVLYEMNKSSASDILSVMDPTQAANLLKLMASIDSALNTQQSAASSQ